MEIREQFTDAEWQALVFAPLWVFCGVASADRVVDESEMAAMAQEVEDADDYNEPLVREVFGSLRAHRDLMQAYRADDRDMDAGLAEAADILASKAEPSHAEAFKKALLFVGRRVAEASTEDDLRGQNVSGEEELTLFRVADILGVSLD